MNNTFTRLGLVISLASLIAVSPAHALESATTGSQATQATVSVINSKVDTTNAIINNVLLCNASRKFYAPTDAKKDANGCVGIQDYDLTMNGTSQITASGLSYGVYGLGAGAGSYGVYGHSTATGSYGGVFIGGAYGVYANAPTYAGYFQGNVNINGSLCFNGANCTSGGGHAWGGSYGTQTGNGWGWPGECSGVNPYTGSCSCPSGYNSTAWETGTDVHWVMYHWICYQ